jgi:hypothetical protein
VRRRRAIYIFAVEAGRHAFDRQRNEEEAHRGFAAEPEDMIIVLSGIPYRPPSTVPPKNSPSQKQDHGSYRR